MKNIKKKGKKRSSPGFVQVWDKLIDSEAWKELSCYARTVYIEIRHKYNGSNNGNLSYTYREGIRIMTRNRFSKALKELVNNGLIDIIRSGGLYRKNNIFGLSNRWRSYGQENFKIGKFVVIDLERNFKIKKGGNFESESNI